MPGRPRDQIIGVSFVTSEGVVVKGGGRVVKNVAGYDLPKLLTGSLGTLGIITQLTLKVRPIPEKSAIAWVCFRNLQAVSEALDRLNVSETRPIAVELLNAPAARDARRRPRIADRRGDISPIGYEENAPTVSWQLDRLKSELKDADLTIVDEGQTSPLWASLIEFQALAIGPAELRRQSAPVVGRLVRREARPGALGCPGPRRATGSFAPMRWANRT